MEDLTMESPAHAPPADRELKKQFATWFQAADTGALMCIMPTGHRQEPWAFVYDFS